MALNSQERPSSKVKFSSKDMEAWGIPEGLDHHAREALRTGELRFHGTLVERVKAAPREVKVYLMSNFLVMTKLVDSSWVLYDKPIRIDDLHLSTPRAKNKRSSWCTWFRPKDNDQAIAFTRLGMRSGNTTLLWAKSQEERNKWFKAVDEAQRSITNIGHAFKLTTITQCEKPLCYADLGKDFDNAVLIGTARGLFIKRTRSDSAVKLLALPNITQVVPLEQYGIVTVISSGKAIAFSLSLLQTEPEWSRRMGRALGSAVERISVGQCMEKMFMCLIRPTKSYSSLQFFEVVQAGGDVNLTLQPLSSNVEFFSSLATDSLLQFAHVPPDIVDVHFLQTGIVLVTDMGFEILNINLKTQGNLDANDYFSAYGHQRINPITIFCIHGLFLLCFDAFAIYVGSNGWRRRQEFCIRWHGKPTTCALRYPYLLAFTPDAIEIWHVETGDFVQMLQGDRLRPLSTGQTFTTHTHSKPLELSEPSLGGYPATNQRHKPAIPSSSSASHYLGLPRGPLGDIVVSSGDRLLRVDSL